MENKKLSASRLKKALPYIVLVIFSVSMMLPLIATPFIWVCAPGVVFDVGNIFEKIIGFDILIFIAVTTIYAMPIVTIIIQKHLNPKFYKIQLLIISVVSTITILPVIVIPIINIFTKI